MKILNITNVREHHVKMLNENEYVIRTFTDTNHVIKNGLIKQSFLYATAAGLGIYFYKKLKDTEERIKKEQEDIKRHFENDREE